MAKNQNDVHLVGETGPELLVRNPKSGGLIVIPAEQTATILRGRIKGHALGGELSPGDMNELGMASEHPARTSRLLFENSIRQTGLPGLNLDPSSGFLREPKPPHQTFNFNSIARGRGIGAQSEEPDDIFSHRKGGEIPASQKKVGKVMHEFKHGELKSSSGSKVTSRKQAIAIAMSEAGISKHADGGEIPLARDWESLTPQPKIGARASERTAYDTMAKEQYDRTRTPTTATPGPAQQNWEASKGEPLQAPMVKAGPGAYAESGAVSKPNITGRNVEPEPTYMNAPPVTSTLLHGKGLPVANPSFPTGFGIPSKSMVVQNGNEVSLMHEGGPTILQPGTSPEQVLRYKGQLEREKEAMELEKERIAVRGKEPNELAYATAASRVGTPQEQPGDAAAKRALEYKSKISGEVPTYDEMKPDMQKRANQLAEKIKTGEAEWPGQYVRSRDKTGVYVAALDKAIAEDPTLSEMTYPIRRDVRKSFTSGKDAQNRTSINTLVGHLGRLSESAKGLENRWSPTYNTLANLVESEKGDPRVRKFNLDATAVENELSTVFKGLGGTGTDQETKEWRKNVDSSDSPKQLKTVIQEGVKLLASRLEQLRAKYEQGMGTSSDLRVLSAKSRETLEKLIGKEELDNLEPSAKNSEEGSKPNKPESLEHFKETVRKAGSKMSDADLEAYYNEHHKKEE